MRVELFMLSEGQIRSRIFSDTKLWQNLTKLIAFFWYYSTSYCFFFLFFLNQNLHLLFEVISQTCFFALPWRKLGAWSHCVERFAAHRINRILFFPWVLVGFFSFSETMENGFKSHVSYFTLWQVMQAPPYKWRKLKVRGIRKWQIVCAPYLSFLLSFSLPES